MRKIIYSVPGAAHFACLLQRYYILHLTWENSLEKVKWPAPSYTPKVEDKTYSQVCMLLIFTFFSISYIQLIFMSADYIPDPGGRKMNHRAVRSTYKDSKKFLNPYWTKYFNDHRTQSHISNMYNRMRKHCGRHKLQCSQHTEGRCLLSSDSFAGRLYIQDSFCQTQKEEMGSRQ